MNTLQPPANTTPAEHVFQRPHDNIVSRLWCDLEASRSEGYSDEATSKSHDGSKQNKPKPERDYFV